MMLKRWLVKHIHSLRGKLYLSSIQQKNLQKSHNYVLLLKSSSISYTDAYNGKQHQVISYLICCIEVPL